MVISKFKTWQKPIVIMLLSLLMFTTSIQTTSAIFTYASSKNTEETVHAKNVFVAAWEWVEDKWVDAKDVADAVDKSAAEGQTVSILPNKLNPDVLGGPFSKDAVFEGLEDESHEEALRFLGYQYWASQYGVYSSSGGAQKILGPLKFVGRFPAGLVLLLTTIVGHSAELVGEIVYSSIEVFNIFRYVLPEDPGDGAPIVWEYDSENDNPIARYFSQWLNAGRFIGFLAALVLFALGLALSVLGFRMGNAKTMGGSIFGTVKRLVISVFALTGALFMLSGIITMFADSMSTQNDSLTMNEQISSLILDYKGFVTNPYVLGDETKNMASHSFGGYADKTNTTLGDITAKYVASDSSAKLGGGLSLPGEEIRFINSRLDLQGGDVDADLTGAKAINNFADSKAYYLISGWMMSGSTSSQSMEATYGEGTMPVAMYRVHTKNGDMEIENRGLLSGMTMFSYYDFTVPGGFVGFLRGVLIIMQTFFVVWFAINVYTMMFRSMITMAQRIVIQIPSVALLGSGSSLFLLAGSVLVMVFELVIGRVTISFFKELMTGIEYLFPALLDYLPEVMPSGSATMGVLNMGVANPFMIGAIDATIPTTGGLLVSVVVTGIAGYYALKLFLSFVANLGSSIDNFFVDLATRIAGVRPDAARSFDNSDIASAANIGGSSATADEAGAGGYTTTTTGSISRSGMSMGSEASEMGLGGSVIGGIGASDSQYGMSQGRAYVPGEEDADYADNEAVSSESVIGSSTSSDEDVVGQPLGSIGDESGAGFDGMDEESTTTSTMSGGSSTSGMGSESAISDMDGNALGAGDTESESVHTDSVSREQEIDEDSGSDPSVVPGSDETMDTSSTVSGTDRVSTEMDEVMEDASSDNSLANARADEQVDGVDRHITASAGESTYDYDSDSGDASAGAMDNSENDNNVLGGQSADSDAVVDMDGSNTSVVYDESAGNMDMGNLSNANNDFNEADLDQEVGQDTDHLEDVSVHQDATDDHVEVDVHGDKGSVDATARKGDTDRDIGSYDYDTGQNKDASAEMDVSGESGANDNSTVVDGEFEEIEDYRTEVDINGVSREGSEQVTDSSSSQEGGGRQLDNDYMTEATPNDTSANVDGSSTAQGSTNSTVIDGEFEEIADYRTEVDMNGVTKEGSEQATESSSSQNGSRRQVNNDYMTEITPNDTSANVDGSGTAQGSTNSTVIDGDIEDIENYATDVDVNRRTREGSEQVADNSSNRESSSNNQSGYDINSSDTGYNTAATDVDASSSTQVTSEYNVAGAQDVEVTPIVNNNVGSQVNQGAENDTSPGQGARIDVASAQGSTSNTAAFGAAQMDGYENSRSSNYEDFNENIEFTTTTTYNGGGGSGSGSQSSAGVSAGGSSGTSRAGTAMGMKDRIEVDGGYIDHNGQFHRTTSSALMADFDGLINRSGQADVSQPVPPSVRRSMAAAQSSGPNVKQPAKGSTKPAVSEPSSTNVESAPSGGGIADRLRGTTRSKTTQSSYNMSESSNEVSESSATVGSIFGNSGSSNNDSEYETDSLGFFGGQSDVKSRSSKDSYNTFSEDSTITETTEQNPLFGRRK